MTKWVCRACEQELTYHPDRYAWVHKQAGADHAPEPQIIQKDRKEKRRG